ncbi:MAG: methionine--tRNA ligase [Deltaproteobacteria bacterium]|nr:MAG: methionine--tRNA ligase [Deltaproteobacteria bacterium]
MKDTFYVTTPIYYVNDVPHIGHAYTTIAADVLARYKRLCGLKTFFLTGTDEHGQKIEKAARELGITPKELADGVVGRFKDLWRILEISNDDFIRTTEPRHERAVLELFNRIWKKGDIYLGEYEDWYCVPCESFWTEKELGEGRRCPECGRQVDRLREKSYFFRLSRYQEPLLRLLEENPNFVKPQSRYNEVLSFVKGGLKDLSISRMTSRWGIPLPNDPDCVLYVWFDALVNYLSGIGFPEEGYEKIWPADCHLIGKDILRFHAIYWPAFLMSAGLPVPRMVFAHGWWTVEGQKMSKSLGNVVDPYEMAERYGVDQFRYFLMREVSFGLDGDFSQRAIVNRINSELANDFGNLVSRTLAMVRRYLGGRIPSPSDGQLRQKALHTLEEYRKLMDDLSFQRALLAVWELIGSVNKYIDSTAPWSLYKEKRIRELKEALYNCLECLRFVALMVYPFMPRSAQRLWEMLGFRNGIEGETIDKSGTWGGLPEGQEVAEPTPLFPRMEV